jgi:hypothetical protein
MVTTIFDEALDHCNGKYAVENVQTATRDWSLEPFMTKYFSEIDAILNLVNILSCFGIFLCCIVSYFGISL